MDVSISKDGIHRKLGLQSVAVIMAWLCFLLPLVQTICASTMDRDRSGMNVKMVAASCVEEDGMDCACDLFGLSANEEYEDGLEQAPHAGLLKHTATHPVAPPEYRGCHREQLTPPPDRQS